MFFVSDEYIKIYMRKKFILLILLLWHADGFPNASNDIARKLVDIVFYEYFVSLGDNTEGIEGDVKRALPNDIIKQCEKKTFEEYILSYMDRLHLMDYDYEEKDVLYALQSSISQLSHRWLTSDSL